MPLHHQKQLTTLTTTQQSTIRRSSSSPTTTSIISLLSPSKFSTSISISTNAGLALAAPTVGIYLPCYDIFRNWFEEYTAKNAPVATTYVPLVAGSLARSLACATCYPIELAKTRMQAFKETQIGKKPPGVYQTLLGVVSNVKGTSNSPNSLQGYRALWTGMGAQLARDVPFSAICWSTLEPTRRKLISLVGGDDAGILIVLGANFPAGVVAGTLAAGATCPLDVAKTRR